MSDRAQRALWAEHLRDEAGAIAEQQVTAGDTHSPVEGPLPHTRNDAVAAVRDAVLAEREQCAALAASFAGEAKLLQAVHDATPEQLQFGAALARQIGEAIRTRTDPGA